ncbi:MAG TPA: hypothetical protein VKR79_08450 [Gaiellaceae bacterium]|nr:hypothetical protein [Gaiellaceae bacterium]
MRRFAGWVGGAAGGIALFRLWKRWQEPVPLDETDSRVDELRAKLAETRAAEDAPPESLEERRRRVHEEGRAAIDEMKGD